jgi:ketosteroid isomerase-like protein
MERREESVRRLLEAWNERDEDGILALTTPDPVYVNPPNAVEPGTRRGRDELIEVFRKQWDLLGDARMDIDQIHIRGEDEAIVEGRISRGMPDSPARIENKALLKAVFRGDLIQRFEALGAGSDYDEALEAAGLDD